MLLPVFAALAAALLFYLILPLAGAFRTRSSWRHFRRRLIELRALPRLRYRHIAAGLSAGKAERREAAASAYRLYGRVEALEGEDRLWLRGAEATALVDLSASPLYVLASPEGATSPWSPDRAEGLERIPWARVRVFSEGTKLFVGGRLSFEEGRPVFVAAPNEELVVVSYDGEDEGLFSRLIAAGRRRNEYWNPLSRISLSLGIGGLGILLALLAGREYFPSVRFFVLLIALAPVIPLAPPGLGCLLAYRALWRRALGLRILRDLLRLPLGYFEAAEGGGGSGRGAAMSLPSRVRLPDGGIYGWKWVGAQAELENSLLLDPEFRNMRQGEGWLIFEAEDGGEKADPAAERVVVRGEPTAMALEAERGADRAALAAGLCLALALVVNLGLAYALWRLQL